MRRTLLFAGGAALLALPCSAQSAQSAQPLQFKPVTAPVKDAGVYNLATGQWTRAKNPQAHIGTDIIYNNTCNAPIYGILSTPAETLTDEGRVPSPSSPNNLQSKPGCASTYTVNGFQMGYCTDQTAVTVNITFFDQYGDCTTDPATLTPLAGFGISGLPASSMTGSLACWVLTLDLEAPPQSVDLSFTLSADGDGTFGTTDTFGFGFNMPLTAGNDGPLVAGDDGVCTRWGETIWDPMGQSASTQGTGMGTASTIRLDGNAMPGCGFYGGTAISSLYMELYATEPCMSGPTTVTPYCFGSAATCPCGGTDQASTDGLGGCEASFGTGGLTLEMVSATDPSVSDDTDGTPQVAARTSRGPAQGSSHLLFQGTTQIQTPFGDGLRCAGGSVVRLGVRNFGATGGFPAGELSYDPGTFGPASNMALAAQGAVPAGGGSRFYQGWYRNTANFCTSAVFNLTNAVQVDWLP